MKFDYIRNIMHHVEAISNRNTQMLLMIVCFVPTCYLI